MSKLTAYLGLLLAMLLWGTSFVALKIALLNYPPFTVVFGRMFVATFIFFLIWPKIKPKKIYFSDLKLILLMALFEPCLYFIFEGYALKYTSASQASLIVATLPLMVGIGANLLLKEPLNLKIILGFILAILGVYVLTIFSHPESTSPNPYLGNFLEFLAMAMATGYTLLVRLLSRNYHPFFLSAAQAIIGSLFFLPLALYFDPWKSFSFHISGFLAILYLGSVVSFLAYSLYNQGVGTISASKAAAFVNLIPVFTLFFSWLLLKETLNLPQIGGAILVGIGIALSQEIFQKGSRKSHSLKAKKTKL